MNGTHVWHSELEIDKIKYLALCISCRNGRLETTETESSRSLVRLTGRMNIVGITRFFNNLRSLYGSQGNTVNPNTSEAAMLNTRRCEQGEFRMILNRKCTLDLTEGPKVRQWCVRDMEWSSYHRYALAFAVKSCSR
mmetsp:Transcript_11474/g.23338  ORF Transcript_11474/g.23338 Transcript_11474/m.23338 type:complete len:137 (-) Transcript_11474:405-815(-)